MIPERRDRYIVRYYRNPLTDRWYNHKGIEIPKDSLIMTRLINNWSVVAKALRLQLGLPPEPIVIIHKDYKE